jgi:hypothetical protein
VDWIECPVSGACVISAESSRIFPIERKLSVVGLFCSDKVRTGDIIYFVSINGSGVAQSVQ